MDGWLTDAQARMLWDRAEALPAGSQIVEIGSFRGRSAIVLRPRGRRDVPGSRRSTPTPAATADRRQIEADAAAGEDDNRAFNENLARAGVADRVRHVRLPSDEAMGEVEGELDLLYVDGAHRYRPALADLDRWGARVRPGGHMLVHDAFSSIGVTLAQLRLLVAGRRFRYLGRAGSLVEYRREDLSGPERARNAARQLAQLPVVRAQRAGQDRDRRAAAPAGAGPRPPRGALAVLRAFIRAPRTPRAPP